MKMNFSLSILFSLHDGKEIRYEGKWSGERRWDLPNDWIEVRVSPIEMANAETPENLAELLIDNIGRGMFYEHKPILDEKSQIIQDIKTIHSMDEIATITLIAVLDDGKDRSFEQRFEYNADTKLMRGFSKGTAFLLSEELYGDLRFSEAMYLNLPRYEQGDGTHQAVFYNETDEEKAQRLWNEFNEKMESFEKEYGNAKDAYLANLKRFPSYPDVERAKQIIDYDAKIVFPNKYILVYGCTESSVLSKEIEKRGAFYRDCAVKKADFFVLWDPDDFDGRHHSTIEKMLDFRDRGGEAVFVTAYQLWKALKNDSASLSSDEMEILSLEREEKQILSEIYKLREMIAKQKEIIGEKRKKEAERERKEKEKAEKALARQMAIKAEEERKEEIRKRKEAKQEQQRIAEEAREKKKTALEEARASATILYAPGQEPDRIKKRIETLLEKLDEAYPDHVIVRLGKDHKKWGETITEIYRLLGYADNRSFLEAYGFTMGDDTGGRPTTLDPDSIIEELMKRYPQGLGSMTMVQVKQANPDLKIKTLENKAFEIFGETLAKHLQKCWANKTAEEKK